MTNSANTTHPVGTKTANELGIYDLTGNVFEWCWDWYGSYPTAQTNYQGAGSGPYRVDRGGSWGFSTSFCHVASQAGSNPYQQVNIIGFRVVLLDAPATPFIPRLQ